MTKTTAVVCFERKDGNVCIKGLYFAHRCGQVDMTNCISACYETLAQAYVAILKVAKINGYIISFVEEFEARRYDIMWIDCSRGTAERYYVR